MSLRCPFGHLCSVLLVVLAAPLLADEEADVAARLARAPQPWKERARRPTFDAYVETLRFWAEKYPGLVRLQTRGQTKEGRPILLASISDFSVPAQSKQILLVTAMHSGAERSGTTAVLQSMEWLLGDSELARQTRRQQLVLSMPVINPWGYEKESPFNSQGIDPYSGQRGKAWDIANLALREPEKTPEIAAFKSVVDEFKPDVHFDMHGVSMGWQGQQVVESCGTSYSNYALRPWDARLTESMIAGARRAGYGIDRGEADTQRLFWGPDMTSIADRLWLGRPFFYTSTYAYAAYHTLPITAEITWEESALARLKALLEIGNGTWDGEATPGYPVNVMKSVVGQWIMPWGRNPAERRRSRIEMWQRQGGFNLAILYPQTDCRASLVVGVTRKGVASLVTDRQKWLTKLASLPNMNTAALRAFVAAGPESKLYLDNLEKPAEDRPLENGLAIRLRIPYRSVELCDLRLNGHLLAPSAADGYQQWFGDGFTQVQINIPPEKTRSTDLFIATCSYKPDVRRVTGWQPPPEVVKRLEKARAGGK